MNKKIVFESIFVLVLLIASSYLIFALLANDSLVTVVMNPANNTNLTAKTDIMFYINFTCAASNLSGNAAPVNFTLLANFNGTNVGDFKKLNETDINVENATFGFNVSNLSAAGDVRGVNWADGVYQWACRVGYGNGTYILTSNRTITIDRTPPIARFLTPNDTWISNNTNQSAILFGGNSVTSPSALNWFITANVSDTTGVPNCSLVTDVSGVYATNYVYRNMTISGNEYFVINYTQLNSFNGLYLKQNWSGYFLNISCTDSVNLTSNSTQRIRVKVDGEYPTGNITTQNSSSTLYFENWSNGAFVVTVLATDTSGWSGAAGATALNSSGLTNCSLYGDFGGSWALNQTVDVVENTKKNFSVVRLATNTSGYSYVVTCRDRAGNFKNVTSNLGYMGMSIIRVDSVAPTPTLSSSAGTTLNMGQSTTLTCGVVEDVNVSSTTISVSSGESTSCGSASCSLSYTLATTNAQTVTCNVRDNLFNSGTTSLTLSSVESSAGGGGGGGGGGGSGTGKEFDIDFTKESKGTLYGGEGVQRTFTLDGSTEHTIEFSKVKTTSITLIIKSDPLNVDLVVGQSRKIDIDNDGIGDIKVALKSILSGEAQIEVEDITPLNIIITEPMGEGSIIPLMIHGETYNLVIGNVGVASTTVTLASQTIDLVIGETQSVDVNGDGTNDVEITLDSITESKPQFTIKEIPLAAAEEEIATPEATKMSAKTIGLIGLGIIILIALIIYLVERRKR